MPISSSQILNTSSTFYSSIVEAFLLGQNTGSNNLLNLKTGSTQSSTLSGGASFGSDVDGDYVQITSTTDSQRNISTAVSRSDSAYSFICTVKLDSTAPTNNYSGMFALVNSTNQNLASFQYQFGSPVWYHNASNFAAFSSSATTTAFATYVFVWTGTLLKVFRTSVASVSASYTAAPITGSGTVTNLRIGNERTGVVSWPGKYYFFARINSALSDTDAQSIADNVSQLLSSGVTYTYARPTSDITTQWSPSTGTDHFALIDETTANDSDYIYATAAGQTDEVRLASMTAPQAGTDLLINYRVQGIVGSASVTMSLRQGSGGTLIATDTAKTIDNTYQLVVPAATWASVTDWTDLRLRFVSA